MKKIKAVIVHYRDCVSAGGSLSVGEVLANHLGECEVEPHLLFAYGGPGPISARLRVPAHYIYSRGPSDLQGWRRAHNLIRDLKPDVIHFQDLVVWFFVSLITYETTKLLHIHGPMEWRSMPLVNRIIWRSLGRMCDGFICITDAAEKSIAELRISNPRTWVVRNAIDIRRFERLLTKSVAREMLGLPSAAKLIGTVCRLVPDKGCADALMVLSRLPKNWHLAIAGDGPLRSELVKKVEQLRIQDRVHFLGFIQDPCVVYAAIDAFILGIRFEPFGMVIAEAMAAQVPVFLLGGEGGYRESTCPLVTTENAIVIERRKQADRYGIESLDVIDELAAAIQRIDADRRARREMVKTARAWVEKHFSGSSAASSTALVYRGALGSR